MTHHRWASSATTLITEELWTSNNLSLNVVKTKGGLWSTSKRFVLRSCCWSSEEPCLRVSSTNLLGTQITVGTGASGLALSNPAEVSPLGLWGTATSRTAKSLWETLFCMTYCTRCRNDNTKAWTWTCSLSSQYNKWKTKTPQHFFKDKSD